jgi:ADP-ribose pyrophosphatase YjhB (NUDIX family)
MTEKETGVRKDGRAPRHAGLRQETAVAAGDVAILSQPVTWRHHVLARVYRPLMWLRNSLRHRMGQISIGTCAIIAKADGTVLLVRHSYRPGWCLPGGGLKRGEAPSAGLARELLEEVGLELTAPPRLRGVYLQPWFGMVDYPILFTVDGDHGVAGSARVVGGLEILEVGWFPATDLPPDTDPSVRARLADWLRAGTGDDRQGGDRRDDVLGGEIW